MNLSEMRKSLPLHVTHGKDINALIDYAEALEDLLEDVQQALYEGQSAENIGAVIHYRLQCLEES
jgi:hypothetical protein